MIAFLHWLLVASLQACVILPWTWLLAALSQRVPSAWLSTLLAAAMLLPAIAPWIDVPGKTLVVPALAQTGLYDAALPHRLPVGLKEPLPPASGEAARTLALEQGWRAVLLLWAAGVALTVLGRFWNALRERLRLGPGEPVAGDDPLLAEWATVAAAAGLKTVPWLVRSRAIKSPRVSGMTLAALFVPPDFDRRPAAERAMIFTHEAEHLARRDPQWRLLLEAVRAVFWFHPLFSWTLRKHDLRTEEACDAAVIRAGHAPRDYAELLLAEARRHRRGGKQLRARVRGLLAPERSRDRTATPALKAGYAALFALLFLPAFALKIGPWEDEKGFRPLAPREPVAAWWRCTTGHGGILPDWSGRGLHARILGPDWLVDPDRGRCLEFNGKGDMIALPAVESDWTEGPLTFAMWLRPREGSDGGGLLLRGEPNRAWSSANEHRFETGHTAYGEREIVLAGDIETMHEGHHNPGLRPGLNLFGIVAVNGPAALPAGRWSHLALTIAPAGDQIVLRWFIDARLSGERRFPRAHRTNRDWPTSWWWFGRGESPPVQGNDFEGRLAELAVLRRALDEKELRELMAGRMPDA